MKDFTSYKVKITEAVGAFDSTADVYVRGVKFFMDLILNQWDDKFSAAKNQNEVIRCAEILTVTSKNRPVVPFSFKDQFDRFPSYLRRAAIAEAYGAVSSYQTRLEKWKKKPQGRQPGLPKVGRTFPALYKGNMFRLVDKQKYLAELKVFDGKRWAWLRVRLRKSDVDYIERHCKYRIEGSPTLRKRGKNWFLEFPFEQELTLDEVSIFTQIVLSVDLGLNNQAVCVAMKPDGTVVGRKFFKLPTEKARLDKALSRIRCAQTHGARKMPRLWAIAKGVNDDIAVKTAQFIIDCADYYKADVIVMEHLDLKGRKRGSKRQRLHHWRAQYVQQMVEQKAHRKDMRISRVCAWNTSKLAFDGSGEVTRDADNYSMCTFKSGKRYNCDLSAAYNIAARYFIREILKSLPARERQRIEAKVPECAKRITCTCSSLIKLCAELGSL